jgi:hypothetical protein
MDLTEKRRIEKARTPMRMRVKAHSTPPKALRRRPGAAEGAAAASASVSAIVCAEVGRGREISAGGDEDPRDRGTHWSRVQCLGFIALLRIAPWESVLFVVRELL